MRGEEEKVPPACGRNWAEFPPDVLIVVFMKIGTIDLLRAVGFVCRSWRKLVTEEPDLWRRIDMTNHGYRYNAFLLTAPTRLAIDRSRGRLEEFSIESFGDDKLLLYLCDRTSVLKSFCLISCYLMSGKAIAEMAKRQPLLEEILIKFVFGPLTEIVGKECPHLKSLKLQYFLNSRESDDDERALGIAKTMHQLHHLQLIGDRLTNEGLKAILDGCPHLETLDIRQCNNVNMDADMWACCSRLKTIKVGRYRDFT